MNVVETRDGVRLNLVRSAEGPVSVVLVHGLASNARLWTGVMEELSARGTPSVAVDLRGHGESDRPDDGFDTPSVADDVADVVRAVADGPVVLVGQSWGGNVVMECSARHPGLAKAVVGVDGGIIKLSDEFVSVEGMWETLAPPRFDGITMDQMEEWIQARMRGWPETAVVGAMANFEELPDGTLRARLSRDRHRRILEGMYRHDPDATISAIDAWITLIIAGEADRKRRRIEHLQSLAQRPIAVEWMDAHHDVHAQHPDVVAAMIHGLI